ncbi:MAG: DUF1292 domain-containing protein [Bacilli bacterium]|nr:DUF1292 domain-containing protein [Bacilli bacterium]
MENEKIVILKDGEEVECDVLFTFDSTDTNKGYIGYTDNSIGENGRKNIYVSSFDPVLGTCVLESITDKDELSMVHDVLEEIERQSK